MKINILLKELYKIQNRSVRSLLISAILKIEGGYFYSKTIRELFKKYHFVDVGMYTHGGCFVPGNFDKYTTIGKYCSIASKVKVFNRNHPVDFKSMHAFFFNSELKYCTEDLVEYHPLRIEHDVWIGHNAIVLPHVERIGVGAVVGAGAVVSKDVSPYSIVVGNPAKEIKKRFSDRIIEELIGSQWWNLSIDEIKPNMKEFQRPYLDTIPPVGRL